MDKYLCEKCKHMICIFGTHRCGCYCQYSIPFILNFKLHCPNYEFDNDDKTRKRKYELYSYPNLLSDVDQQFIRDYGYEEFLKRNNIKPIQKHDNDTKNDDV